MTFVGAEGVAEGVAEAGSAEGVTDRGIGRVTILRLVGLTSGDNSLVILLNLVRVQLLWVRRLLHSPQARLARAKRSKFIDLVQFHILAFWVKELTRACLFDHTRRLWLNFIVVIVFLVVIAVLIFVIDRELLTCLMLAVSIVEHLTGHNRARFFDHQYSLKASLLRCLALLQSANLLLHVIYFLVGLVDLVR